jgi:tetratricopeptide (TPR) repeat protein
MKTYHSHSNIITIGLFFSALMLTGCSKASKAAHRLERAESNFKSGHYDEARIDYTAVLRGDPNNKVAIQRLGQIWSEDGAPLTAMPFLMRTSEHQPNDLPTKRRLLEGYVAMGQFKQAKAEAEEIWQSVPTDAEVLFLLAQAQQTPAQNRELQKLIDKFPAKKSAGFHLAAATMALRKNERSTAEAEMKQAIAADPKSSLAHAALGQYYAITKELEKAADELKLAADLAPVRSKARTQYAEFLFLTGKVKEAKAVLADMAKVTPDYLPIYRLQSRIALSEKNYGEAHTALQSIFGRDSEDLEAHLMEADVLIAEGKPKQAVEALQQLDTTYQGNVPTIKYRLARAALANKDSATAEKVLDQVITQNPGYTDAILARSELYVRSGRAGQAIAPLEEILKQSPNSAVALELLAEAYRAVGRFEEATNLFHRQITIGNNASAPYFNLGLTKVREKKPDEARQYFEKAIALDPENILIIEQLVDLDIDHKDYESAMGRVAQFQQKHPDSAPAYFVQGKIFAGKTEWENAAKAFARAVELDPGFEKARQLLISAYLADDKIALAITELEAFLEKNPDDSRARLLLATAFEKEKNFTAAREEYEKLLAANPKFVPALNNLAWLYAEKFNQLEKANQLAQKAASLQPNDGSTIDTLGWILYKRGAYQEALSRLEESAQQLPNNPAIQYHLGMTLSMMGKMEGAREALAKAAAAQTDFPGKDEAKRRLALLERTSGPGSHLSASELEALLKQDPNDPLVASSFGDALARENQLARAAVAYEQALKLNSKLPGPTLKLAQLYSGPLNDPAKAVTYARKAKELAPNDPETTAAVGEIAYQTNNFTWAYTLLQTRARAGDKNPALLHDLAMTAYALGKVPEARATMEECLRSGASELERAGANDFLAMVPLEKPTPEVISAEAQVNTILARRTDFVPALMAKAAIEVEKSQPTEAAATYSKVLQRYPDFAPAQMRLAAIYADNPANLGKAYDLAVKARSNLRDDPEMACILARISFKRKEFSYAAQLFEQAAAAGPLAADDLYYLGLAELQSHQEEKGRTTLDRALKAGLSGPAADEAKRRLAEAKAR